MKTNLLLIFIFTLWFSANAQTDQKAGLSEWKKVDQLNNQSLPKSALEVVNRIYQNALKEGNSPELIKSMIYKLKLETVIDRDQLPERIREMEAFAAADTNQTEQAILYSVLADLYGKYYLNDVYTVNQRTALPEADAGADPKTWPANVFIQRIADYVKRSLKPVERLQQTNVLEYKDLLEEGESSRQLRPTLYDFLVRRGIDLLRELSANPFTEKYFSQTQLSDVNHFLPVKDFVNLSLPADAYDFAPQMLELYRNLLAFRLRENDPFALLMTDLDRLEFVLNNSENERMNPGENYLAALRQLEKQHITQDFCAEILYRQADYYSAQNIRNNYFDAEKFSQEASIRQAYDVCLEGIKRYPAYERIGLLQNLLEQITQSELTVQSDNTVYPGKALNLQIHYRNLDKITLRIYRINVPVSAYVNNWDRSGRYAGNGKLVVTQSISLVNEKSYSRSDTTIKIPIEALGNYEYVIYPDKDEKSLVNQQFSVSRLATVARTVKGKCEFLVADLLSGKPVEGASVHLYKKNNNRLVKTETLRTNANGLVLGGEENDLNGYQATYGKDTSLLISGVPWLSGYYPPELQSSTVLTDRSIYRPGQTVYFKGIVYGLEKMQVIPNRKITVALRDPKGQDISRMDVTTNEWGSYTGTFVLPQGMLNGQFAIGTDFDKNYTPVYVEEYKRPTFDIQFDRNENTYRYGDRVTVKGNAKTFSGVRMQNVKVKYRITRNNHWFYRMYRPPVQVASGDVLTDEQGLFEIPFTPEKAFADQDRKNVSYTYTVTVDMTDAKGETQNSETQIHTGDIPFILSMTGLPDEINRDSLSVVQIQAVNLSNHPVAVSGGAYRIYSLKPREAGKLDNKKADWMQDQLLFEDRFESGKAISLSCLQSSAAGKYRLIATAGDAEDCSTDFTLFTNNDQRPPIPVSEWLAPIKTRCAVGEKAEIIYGSSAKEVYVLYEIFKDVDNKKVSASRFVLNNETRTIEIPFLKSYGDGITVSFTFIKEARVFSKTVTVLRKQPDQQLDLTTAVFRDRLLPGQKEEWKISVKDAAQKGVAGELLAAMYDASLDKIRRHDWSFRPVRNVHLPEPFIREGNEFSTSMRDVTVSGKYAGVPDFKFDALNWFGFSVNGYNVLRKNMIATGAITIGAGKYRGDEALNSQVEDNGLALLSETVEIPSPAEDTAIQIRQNFNETAFFYPQLKTGEAGETLIAFTIPESNTTWKFMGLAHTKDLRFGQIVREAISRKPLMVAPNIPRFIRESDRTTLSTQIANLSESTLSGTVDIAFFDPNDNQTTTIAVPKASRPFTVEAGQTVAVSWAFDVPAGVDLTAVKIVAKTAGFSDGEQHLIPILPNRTLVTESLPLDISSNETKTVSFDRMGLYAPTRQNHRLTLEFTNNPVWYAVQALPALTAPQSDDVLSWFGAYYAHVTAVRLAQSTPKIKQIIDIWTQQSGTKETLLSDLEKNRELKAVVLEETPWAADARNETEMKQKLSLLFDANRTDYLRSQALDKLRSLQTEEGGWTWFKGMNPSLSITQWILYGLKETGETEVKEMQEKAVRFIDLEMKRHYDDYTKSLKAAKDTRQVIPSVYELEYLFVRSLYPEIPIGEAGEAVKYYTSMVEKHWTSIPDLYGRAIAALFLQQSGKAALAQAIVNSLREHASHKPDLGMYWANARAHSFFFNSAIANHYYIMKAFYETGAPAKEMDEMKQWLLKQKQTQEWESLPGLVGAVQILLQTGSNWLEDAGKTTIQLGDRSLDTSRGDAGTGYIKQVFAADDITPDMNRITIRQENAVPGWGALYWQYFEDSDQIKAAKTGLNVEKTLLVEKTTATGKALSPITEATPVKIGDKVVVRLVVRADRDFEYVLLKDMRASCLEPVEQISGIRWAQAAVYYQSPKDASMNYYFNHLPKGTYVFEYPLYVTGAGNYSNGIATIQCLYAPGFVSHTAGGRICVD